MGELHGVGQQVVQDLLQPRQVAAAHAAGGRRGLDAEAQALVGGGRLVGGLQGGGQLLYVEVRRLKLHAARLDLGQIQDVVEHGQQGLARLADDAQTLALLGLQIAHGHDLRHGQHAVQRRPDLVAHIGQEVGFQNIGRLGRVARLDQLVHGLMQRPVVAF